MTKPGTRLLVCTILALLVVGCGGTDDPPADPVPSETVETPVLPDEPLFEVEEGLTTIPFEDFVVFESKPSDSPSWRDAGGRIECLGGPKGYLYTKESYGDFTLRFDYRFPEPEEAEDPTKLNTGVLVFVTGEHRAWPKCLEVQGRWDEMASIKSNARDVTVEVADDPAARETARKPAGEWNTVEIVSKGGALTSYLNGEKIAESQPTELTTGPIGLQSEGNPVHFRYVRIRRD